MRTIFYMQQTDRYVSIQIKVRASAEQKQLHKKKKNKKIILLLEACNKNKKQ